MIARIKKIITISIFIIYAFMLILNALLIPVRLVYAETTEYSNVFDDLSKDEAFDYSKYPSYTYEELKSLNEDDNEENKEK